MEQMSFSVRVFLFIQLKQTEAYDTCSLIWKFNKSEKKGRSVHYDYLFDHSSL